MLKTEPHGTMVYLKLWWMTFAILLSKPVNTPKAALAISQVPLFHYIFNCSGDPKLRRKQS